MRSRLLIALLTLPALAIAAYKVVALGYGADLLIPETLYTVNLTMTAQGRGEDLVLRALLPGSDERHRAAPPERFTPESASAGIPIPGACSRVSRCPIGGARSKSLNRWVG